MPGPRKSRRPRGAKGSPKRMELGEAQAQYRAEVPPVTPFFTARISSKNQITLPVAAMRAIGLKPGDELQMLVLGDVLRARKRLYGRELIDYLHGSVDIPEWRTPEGIEEYIRRERDSWDRDWDETTS